MGLWLAWVDEFLFSLLSCLLPKGMPGMGMGGYASAGEGGASAGVDMSAFGGPSINMNVTVCFFLSISYLTSGWRRNGNGNGNDYTFANELSSPTTTALPA